MVAVLSMCIALAAVGGAIHIGAQSKFIPYVIQVDKLGQTLAAGPVQATDRLDPRVVHAALADFVTCARTVTPDVAMQRKCIYKVYSMLSPNDAAAPKMNEWLNGTDESSPFKRAEREMISIEIKTAIPQTPDTWQVEWLETTRDRTGILKGQPVILRALLTTYAAEITPATTDEQLRLNPLGIYVRDFSWSRVQ
jgi:type IV secretion system protein VirB5